MRPWVVSDVHKEVVILSGIVQRVPSPGAGDAVAGGIYERQGVVKAVGVRAHCCRVRVGRGEAA